MFLIAKEDCHLPKTVHHPLEIPKEIVLKTVLIFKVLDHVATRRTEAYKICGYVFSSEISTHMVSLLLSFVPSILPQAESLGSPRP